MHFTFQSIIFTFHSNQTHFLKSLNSDIHAQYTCTITIMYITVTHSPDKDVCKVVKDVDLVGLEQ